MFFLSVEASKCFGGTNCFLTLRMSTQECLSGWWVVVRGCRELLVVEVLCLGGSVDLLSC